MKFFILVCLALVATQISAAPTEENLSTITSSDATNDDAAKQLITTTEPKANDVETLTTAPTPATTPAPTPEPTPEPTPAPTPAPTTALPTSAPASEKQLVQVKGEEEKESKKDAENTKEKKGDEKTSNESKIESEAAEKSSTPTDPKKSVFQSLCDFFRSRPSSNSTVEFEITLLPDVYVMDEDDTDDDIIEVIIPIEPKPVESAPSRFSGLTSMLSSIPSWFGYHSTEIHTIA